MILAGRLFFPFHDVGGKTCFTPKLSVGSWCLSETTGSSMMLLMLLNTASRRSQVLSLLPFWVGMFFNMLTASGSSSNYLSIWERSISHYQFSVSTYIASAISVLQKWYRKHWKQQSLIFLPKICMWGPTIFLLLKEDHVGLANWWPVKMFFGHTTHPIMLRMDKKSPNLLPVAQFSWWIGNYDEVSYETRSE